MVLEAIWRPAGGRVRLIRRLWRWRLGLAAAVAVAALGSSLWMAWQDLAGQQAVEAMAWAVARRVVVIDAGHGGVDPGAIGYGGTYEKEITLAVARELQNAFTRAGARVVMIRETDTDLSTPGKNLRARKQEDLANRVEQARAARADLYINIQANSFGRRWTGAQTFYHPDSLEGLRLAKNIQRELRHRMRNTERVVLPLDAYVLRHLEIPAALVEVGFISNPQEERLLKDLRYQKKIAFAIYAGSARYLAGETGDEPLRIHR